MVLFTVDIHIYITLYWWYENIVIGDLFLGYHRDFVSAEASDQVTKWLRASG